MKKASDRYLKIVEWSDDDQCYIGRCPALFGGGCHGDNETDVYVELCTVVDDVIADMETGGEQLPAATAGKSYSGKFMLRTKPEVHQRLAIAAMRAKKSLNRFCIDQLERTA